MAETLRDTYTCFDYTTLAAVSDLTSARWKEAFALLERQQEDFLSHEKEFRSKNYKWPSDALRNWSRIWEYPFVYHNIEKWRRSLGAAAPRPVVVDLGSGVTFFPHAIARLGTKVVCTDVDPICGVDLGRVCQIISAAPGCVEFRLGSADKLPFADDEADLVYCISVIEHVRHVEKLIREVRRILKPGGHFILTLDLDLRGDQQVGIAEFYYLHALLDAMFVSLAPIRTPHHADVLTSETGPIRPRLRPWWRIPPFLAKQWLVKPLLGQHPAPLVPFHCAIQGVLLENPTNAFGA
jgi:SAM-dependent methyltransferase